MSKRDAWIRWSYRCNGWMWSVMEGASLIIEGCERTYSTAHDKAEAYL